MGIRGLHLRPPGDLHIPGFLVPRLLLNTFLLLRIQLRVAVPVLVLLCFEHDDADQLQRCQLRLPSPACLLRVKHGFDSASVLVSNFG